MTATRSAIVWGSGPLGSRGPHVGGGRRRRGVRVAAVATLAVVVLGACGTEPGSGGGPTPEPTPTSPELPSQRPTTPVPAPSSPSAAVDAPGVADAVADLADHLGIAPADVTVVSLEDVTWPDGSLGCPQPGMSYTTALVPGSRLVLAAQGREFSYHAGREPVFQRCDRPSLAPTDTH